VRFATLLIIVIVLGDHLKTCEYCQKGSSKLKPTIFIKSASSYYEDKKPTIYVKSAASYSKRKRLTELGAIIRGTSYPSLEPVPTFQTKGASGPIEREVKLKELGKLVRGSSLV
jgi:hypothetical protein